MIFRSICLMECFVGFGLTDTDPAAIFIAMRILGRILCFVLFSPVFLIAQASNDWQESTPERQGIDSSELVKLLEFVKSQNQSIDSLLIARHGRIVLDVYYHPFAKDQPHILNSVTKSFVSALIGIAIEQQFIINDETKLRDWFPEADKPGMRDIELRHLLTMTSGIDWPQYGGHNVSDEMGHSADWIHFILNRRIAATAGTVSNYSNGDAHLLSAILRRATGQDPLQFATTNLFEPLAIPTPQWATDPQGLRIGSAAMFMRPRDMAKFGKLYLHNGNWQGRQVVPSGWIAKSLERHTSITISAGRADYGYFWWLYPKLGMVEAWGGAGQRIGVFHDLDLVTVMTSNIGDDAPVTSFSTEIYSRVLKAVKSTPLPENPAQVDQIRKLVAEAAVTSHQPKRMSVWHRLIYQPTSWIGAAGAILTIMIFCLWRRRYRQTA
jgi:CubicO group peptidase (beta-lactamase class C family)